MRNLPSVMSHTFSRSPQANIPRSTFDRSHAYKTTFDAGKLIPFFLDEALPGDTFACHADIFARLATLQDPLMDNLYLDVHFFAVPLRLLWDNWEKFNGAQTDPGDSTDFLIPTVPAPSGGYATNSLADYFGIPTGVDGFSTSSLPFRAYNLIFNEWYRDENLVDSVPFPTDDGPDVDTEFVLKPRGKRYDYFTSCLPWPQKGTAVSLPLGTYAPVVPDTTTPGTSNVPRFETSGTVSALKSISSNSSVQWSLSPGSNDPITWSNTPGETGLRTDLSTATAATINQLRESFQIQKLYERDARGGTRYTEIIRSHFGVISPDARLQRPEYLGGGTTPLLYHVVPQSAPGAGPTDGEVADLASFSTAHAHGIGFTKSFTEHSYIIGLVSARADLTYQQGLDRLWSRSDRFDFYLPVLSHLGEQAVLNKEIYTQGTSADDDVFGYQERWAEYRYKPSKITGRFRSNASPLTLDTWHLSQDFGSLPTLNSDFIEEDPPISRVVSVTGDYPDFLFDSFIKLKCARPMPVYSVPGLVDHF